MEGGIDARILERMRKRCEDYLKLVVRKARLEGRTKFLVDSEVVVLGSKEDPCLLFGPTQTVEEVRLELRRPEQGEEWKTQSPSQ